MEKPKQTVLMFKNSKLKGKQKISSFNVILHSHLPKLSALKLSKSLAFFKSGQLNISQADVLEKTE